MSKKTILFFTVVSVTIFRLPLIYMAYGGAPSGSQGASGPLDLGYEPGELLVRFAPKPGRVCKINFAHAGKVIIMSLCQITDERNFVEDIIFLRLSPTKGAKFL
jgi:hypothetical protein